METLTQLQPLLIVIAVIVIPILVFILCREFFCWYIKSTEIVGLLKEIVEELQILNGTRDKRSIRRKKLKRCPYCEFPVSNKDFTCPQCKKSLFEDVKNQNDQ